MSAYERNVTRAEDTIRNEQVEHLYLLDDKGRVRFSTSDGKHGEVYPTQEMIDNAKNAVFTHNHPSGGTFSWQDIHVALQLGLKEMRATTANNGTFSLVRNYDIDKRFPFRYVEFAQDYRHATGNIHSVLQTQVLRNQISVEEAMASEERQVRSWLTANAANYGWTYRELKR